MVAEYPLRTKGAATQLQLETRKSVLSAWFSLSGTWLVMRRETDL